MHSTVKAFVAVSLSLAAFSVLKTEWPLVVALFGPL